MAPRLTTLMWTRELSTSWMRPLLGGVHDLDRVTRPAGDDSIKRKGRDESPTVDGHTPFSNRILRVQLSRHFVKLTDMKYDGSTDPHEHLRNFEHQMDPSQPSSRKYVERFNEKCKPIDGLTDSVASLCLTNSLTNDDFKKQLTIKPMWSRKGIQVIAKEFIYHEEISRMVKTSKNPHTHMAPRVNAKPHNPRDNQQDSGFKGQPKPLKQKFKNYTPLAAPSQRPIQRSL
ncbi:hypothetical protein PIB30_005860 [Stylosanthes scabra]|uniref:Uncharacterized protein n=1 Tax=Stylosanthes scabra TaxID=79078 RepID=A0ABU6Z0X9_9FABA|nr:hypothetical protein [Stylosanthes scabra]